MDVVFDMLGYFPHMFNRRETWNYVGEWPAAECYQPQYMKDSEQKKFLEWHAQQVGKEFNFQKELKEYCESDVSFHLHTLYIYYYKIDLPFTVQT